MATRHHAVRSRRRIGTLALSLAVISTTVLAADAAASTAPEILVLSNRADLVSGGDALVEVRLPEEADTQAVRVTLHGRDITEEFARGDDGRYLGLVTGLRRGDNELAAWASRSSGARLTITNHGQQGPVFAGRQVRPWICETDQHGLGPATGPACVAPTRYDYFYKSAVTGRFETYDPASPPADAVVKTTTTDQGNTVPYIVRRERGVIDRGIYDIAVLFQPGEDWQPWAPQAGWNGKVLWHFGGGCAPSHLQSGPDDVLDEADIGDLALSRGFAVATSSLNVLAQNCNDVVSAEAVMMTKEHLVETYGPARYTVGIGCSGGSAMVHLIANNYPGLLDGIMPLCSIPDAWSVLSDYGDCDLLKRHFDETSPNLWADRTQQAAVTGQPADGMCEVHRAILNGRTKFDPRTGCTRTSVESLALAEPAWVYDPQTNPTGVRCTIQDYQAAVFGYRASDGFANRPYDNVGVQYGLVALQRGQISAEQFVDLNVKIGGRDIDYGWTPRRSAADLDGLRNLYRSGRNNDGRQLAAVPIIDVRELADVDPSHQAVHTRQLRARLIAANGDADNHVSWMSAAADDRMKTTAFRTLDRWLAAIERDSSDNSLASKVRRNRPTEARDSCWVAGKPDVCGDGLPNFSRPRMVAGGPLTSDVYKCQLKPIDWADYGSVEFTDVQKRHLRAAFPDGVCDWTRLGVEQQAPAGVWQTFAGMTGGVPLGDPPRSAPLSGAK